MGLVIELRKLALDRSSNMQDLLNQAYVTASLLNLDDFRDWVNLELNGYDSQPTLLPDYRQVKCQFGYASPLGFREATYTDFMNHNAFVELEKAVTTSRISCAVSVLIDFVSQRTESFIFGFPSTTESDLRKLALGNGKPVQRVTRVMLNQVVIAIRHTVLKWAVDLQNAGIIGEHDSFNETERDAAKEKQAALHPHITINNTIVQGDVVNSILQQMSPEGKSQINGS